MAAARRTALIALLMALLAACEQSAETSAPAGKRADGEVLGGTISDEMIPLEDLRSQSPPLNSDVSDDADESGEGGDGAQDSGDAQPATPAEDEG